MHLRFPKKRDFWSWNELRLVKYCDRNGKCGVHKEIPPTCSFLGETNGNVKERGANEMI